MRSSATVSNRTPSPHRSNIRGNGSLPFPPCSRFRTGYSRTRHIGMPLPPFRLHRTPLPRLRTGSSQSNNTTLRRSSPLSLMRRRYTAYSFLPYSLPSEYFPTSNILLSFPAPACNTSGYLVRIDSKNTLLLLPRMTADSLSSSRGYL